jgi:hypothetical protein
MTEKYVIAICTLGENPNLMDCISKLLEIQKITKSQLKILIVFNRIPFGFECDSRVDVVYEPERGYSNVRNAAIENTPKNFNLIFIDDDELPTLVWFEALLSSHRNFPDDLIFGPVLAELSAEPVSYRGKFKHKFDSLQDGALVKQAGAGNLLIPSNLLTKKLVRFDPFFNKSGSEDTDLCFRLRKLGVNIRFSKNAQIFEVQDSERSTVEYLNSRTLRDVCNYSLVVRRNCGASGISRRFITLGLRLLWHSLRSIRSGQDRFLRTVYLRSLQFLIRG